MLTLRYSELHWFFYEQLSVFHFYPWNEAARGQMCSSEASELFVFTCSDPLRRSGQCPVGYPAAWTLALAKK